MATVAFHTLHSTQTVVLTEPEEYNGKTYPAGEYQVPVDGRYWTGFDRQDPLRVRPVSRPGRARRMRRSPTWASAR